MNDALTLTAEHAAHDAQSLMFFRHEQAFALIHGRSWKAKQYAAMAAVAESRIVRAANFIIANA